MRKIKVPFLYLLSFAFSILPVSIYFFVNMDRYVKSVPEGIRLAGGGVLLLIIVLLKVIGKLKMPSRTALFGIVFVLCYLLSSVLSDLIIFSFLALVGDIMDSILHVIIRREREENQRERVAHKTAQEINRVLNGRV